MPRARVDLSGGRVPAASCGVASSQPCPHCWAPGRRAWSSDVESWIPSSKQNFTSTLLKQLKHLSVLLFINYTEEKKYLYLIAFHVVVSEYFFPDNCSQVCFLTYLLERQLRNTNSSFFPGQCSLQGTRQEARSFLCFFFITYQVSSLLVQTSSM